jgi:hypothetical protein
LPVNEKSFRLLLLPPFQIFASKPLQNVVNTGFISDIGGGSMPVENPAARSRITRRERCSGIRKLSAALYPILNYDALSLFRVNLFPPDW